MRDLVIYGAGGFARELAQLARDIDANGGSHNLLGFLSDDGHQHQSEVDELPVLGGLEFLEQRCGTVDVVLGVGSPAVKRSIVERAGAFAHAFPSLVHPTVVRSSRIKLGDGVLVCAGNVLTVDIAIGNFASINLACTIGHDAILHDYVTLAPSVNVSGNVVVGEGCDVGTGTKIVQGRRLGDWSIIGAGAVISADIPANCTAVGVPAKPIKYREQGWHLA